MVPTSHLGYGSFHVKDLLRNEEFVASDGTPGKVCGEQPNLPERIQVWLSPETLNARRVFFHPEARVFASSPEQARRIERRVRARERQSAKKGAGHEPN